MEKKKGVVFRKDLFQKVPVCVGEYDFCCDKFRGTRRNHEQKVTAFTHAHSKETWGTAKPLGHRAANSPADLYTHEISNRPLQLLLSKSRHQKWAWGAQWVWSLNSENEFISTAWPVSLICMTKSLEDASQLRGAMFPQPEPPTVCNCLATWVVLAPPPGSQIHYKKDRTGYFSWRVCCRMSGPHFWSLCPY